MIITFNTPTESPVETENLKEALKTLNVSDSSDESTLDMNNSASFRTLESLEISTLHVEHVEEDDDISSATSIQQQQQEDDDFPTILEEGEDEEEPLVFVKRPALKLNFTLEDIPVSYDKKAWKSLPKPDLGHTRALSCESYFHRNTFSPTRRRRCVTFGDVTIRDYDLTLGDNPSVSYGPPVSLDWKYEEKDPMDLDEYEVSRGQRRKLRNLVLSCYQRKNILMHTYGHSESELKQARKEIKTQKRQRALTKAFLQLARVEEAVESAGRKAKRGFGKQKKSEQPVLKRTISV